MRTFSNQKRTSLGSGLFHLSESISAPKGRIGLDISGFAWMLFRIKVVSGAVAWISDGKMIVPRKRTFWLYLPPYSWTSELYREDTRAEIDFFVSRSRAVTFSPDRPILFYSDQPLPSSLSDIEVLLRSVTAEGAIAICTRPSGVAKRIKEHLDKTYMRAEMINEIATTFQTSQTVISRQFKNAFGHTPSRYRMGLRVTAAMVWLLEGVPPAEAAHRSGYADISRFNKQFRQYMSLVPTAFRSRK